MKFLTAFALLFFLHVQLHAQDTIHKTDGSIILAKVLEVGTSVIKYKRASNLDGPNYTVYKSDVIKIVYQNGEVEVFNDEKEEETVVYETNYYEENETNEHYESTVVMGQDVFQFYYRNFSFFFESRFSKIFAMRYTFYFNFNNDVYRPGFPIQYGVSVYPHFSFYQNKIVSLFVGPHFHHGFSFNHEWVQVGEDWNGNVYVPIYEYERRFRWHTLFLVEPGISINPVKNLDFTIHGGIGFNAIFFDSDPYDSDGLDSDVEFAWKVGITIGGRW